MKILVSHFGLIDNGGFGRTFSIASGLAQLNNKITLITTIKGISNFPFKIEHRSNVKIIAFYDFLPKKYIRNGYGILSLIGKLFHSITHKYQVVYSDTGHRPLSGWPCILNRGIYSSKYFSEWWDIFETEIKKEDNLLKRSLKKYENFSEIANKRKANGVVVLSKAMKERAIQKGIGEEKIEIVHGGADVERICFIESKKVKEKYGFKLDSVVFGLIGISDYDIEDIEPFFHAFSELKEQNIEWFTTGKGLSEKSINKYKLDTRLHQFGWVNYSQSAEILSCADIFVLLKKPTIRNIMGWPNKLGDYLAVGRPVLITPYGDIVEYIKKHPSFFIITENEVSSIKNNIISAINNIDNIRLQNKDIRMVVEKEYSWLERARKINNFIKNNI